jgi:hypothetical protein
MSADDGQPAAYDFLSIATSKDGAADPGNTTGRSTRTCSKPHRTVKLHYGPTRIVRAVVYVDGKRVKVVHRRSVKRLTIPPFSSANHRVKIVLRSARGRSYTSVRTYKGCRKSKPRRVRSRR